MISGYLVTIPHHHPHLCHAGAQSKYHHSHAGQISVGHAAFFGIGAYTSAMLYTEAGFPFWISVPLAAVVAGTVGALLNPCLPASAMISWASPPWVLILWWKPFFSISIFRRSDGHRGINLPKWLDVKCPNPNISFSFCCFILLLLIDRQLGRSWVGLGLGFDP